MKIENGELIAKGKKVKLDKDLTKLQKALDKEFPPELGSRYIVGVHGICRVTNPEFVSPPEGWDDPANQGVDGDVLDALVAFAQVAF